MVNEYMNMDEVVAILSPRADGPPTKSGGKSIAS
jgi:hypothetical protein